jgi:hypothetical protein
MSDEEYRQEGINMQLKPIKDRLKALEKNHKHYNNLDKELTHWVGIMDKNKEQIAKLQENQKNGAKQHLEFIKSINELKSDIGNINKILEVITEGRVLELVAFNNLEDVLRDYFKYRKDWSELIMKKSPFRSPLDTWMMISLHKFMKDALEKLDVGSARQTDDAKQVEKLLNDMGCDVGITSVKWGPNLIKKAEKKEEYIGPLGEGDGEEELDMEYKEDLGGVDIVESSKHTCSFCGRKLILYKQEWICGHGCTKPAIRPDEKLPEFVCSLELQGECGNEGSMDCLKGNSKGERFDNNVCVHGKRELEKPKTIEPEKEFEFQLVEKFIPPRGVHCENCMNNPVPELIEGFKDKLEFLRDKVLEAPILSGSVQDLRDHIHDLKDLVVKNINEYEGMLNK